MAWWRVHRDPEGKFTKKSKTDLRNLQSELEAARSASPEDRPPHRAPVSKAPVRRGGAPHVKRSR